MKKNILVVALGVAALVAGAQGAAALAAIVPGAASTPMPTPSFAWQGHSEGQHGRHLHRGWSGDVRGSFDIRSGDARHRVEFHSGDVRPSFDVRGSFDARDDANDSGDVREHAGHGMWGGPFGSIDVRPSRPTADVRFRPAPGVSGDTRQAPRFGGRDHGHH